MKASGSSAVMAAKRPRISDGQPWQDFELFPTPPWATRALFENVFPLMGLLTPKKVWEPCAGLRHMADVIAEYSSWVWASDRFIYDPHLSVAYCDFMAPVKDGETFDGWIITNPPFSPAADMLERALATIINGGVAFLLRIQWLETEDRYARVFSKHPPSLVAPFAERVPMCEGGWDPKLSTATGYAWFIWEIENGRVLQPLGNPSQFFPTMIIPPGRKAALTRASDQVLATRCVPGWVPPSTLKKSGRQQASLELGGAA